MPLEVTRDEAVRRLKEKFAAARAEYGEHVSKFHDEWKDHTFSFSLHALGMGVSGTVAVEPRKVRLDGPAVGRHAVQAGDRGPPPPRG